MLPSMTMQLQSLTRRMAQTSLRGSVATRDFGKFAPVDKKSRKKSAKERQAQVTKVQPNTNPMQLDVQKFRQPMNFDETGNVGIVQENMMKQLRSMREHPTDIEEQMRDFDYLTADPGSLEDLVGQRRALMDLETEAERKDFLRDINEAIEQERQALMDLGDDDYNERPADEIDHQVQGRGELDEYIGDWSEVLVTVDRVQKVQKGGTMLRYRALVVGGNYKGVVGFGVGKANGPDEATKLASRKAKKNIIFVEPYHGCGLTSDLVGKHNSCKVFLRAVGLNRNLRGNPLVKEILARAGITRCTAKSHGNRNPYNVVQATFKALLTHESIEEIAMKRGRRYLNLDRAKRLQIK